MITQDELKRLMHYNPTTGLFTRLVRMGSRGAIGSVVGSKKSSGYISTRIDGWYYELHRLAFLYMEGYFPEHCVDHIDRDPSNNIWSNLREVSHSCNSMNKKIQSNATSGVVGVNWSSHNKAWVARITHGGCRICLGQYPTKLEAARARYQAEIDYGIITCKADSSAGKYIQECETTYD